MPKKKVKPYQVHNLDSTFRWDEVEFQNKMKIIQVFHVQNNWTLKNLFKSTTYFSIYGLGDDGLLYTWNAKEAEWFLANNLKIKSN